MKKKCCCGGCWLMAVRCECSEEGHEEVWIACNTVPRSGGTIVFENHDGVCYVLDTSQEPVIEEDPPGPTTSVAAVYRNCEQCCEGGEGCWFQATKCDCSAGSPSELWLPCAWFPIGTPGKWYFLDTNGLCYEVDSESATVDTLPGTEAVPEVWYAHCESCCQCQCPCFPPSTPTVVSVQINWTVAPIVGVCAATLSPSWSTTAFYKPATTEPKCQSGPFDNNAYYLRPYDCHFDHPQPNSPGCSQRYEVRGPLCGGVVGGMRQWIWKVVTEYPIVTGTWPTCTPGACVVSPTTCTAGFSLAQMTCELWQPECDPPPIAGTFTFIAAGAVNVSAGTMTIT